MKAKNILIYIICALAIICVFCIPVFAQSSQTSNQIAPIEMEEEDKKFWLGEFYFESKNVSSGIYEDNFIYCFDVSQEQKCAVFFDNAVVVIFDSEGTVEKALKFNEEIVNTRRASNVKIKWVGNNLELIYGYGVICVFTPDGDIIDIYRHEAQLSRFPNDIRITVERNTYEIDYNNFLVHFMGGNRYDTLIKTDANGKQEVFFKCEKSLPSATIVVILFVIVFTAFALFIVFKTISDIKARRRLNTNTGDGSLS